MAISDPPTASGLISGLPTPSAAISGWRTASRAISGLATPSVAISERPAEFRSRSIAASPPPLLSSSRTSAERTPLVSEMSFDLTSPLTMSSLNTVPVAGSATAVPLRATKRAR